MAVTVEEKLITVLERIRNAARKAGRDPSEISLIAVTKSINLRKVKEAYSSGIRIFGENYVQETQEKVKKLKRKGIKWHFIGHLQKNKAKIAVELYDVIHTVDNLSLAVELNKRVRAIKRAPIDVLIQVSIAGEKTKFGIDPEGAVTLARSISGLEHLRLRGLMAIPPRFENPQMSRPYFVTLRRLAERINKERLPNVVLKDLSVGMSNDFEVAIEEGATMVRIGTAIFGDREGAAVETVTPKVAKSTQKTAVVKKAVVAKKAVKKAAPVKKKAVAKKAVTKAVAKKSVSIKTAAVAKKKATVKKKAVPVKKTAVVKKPATVQKKAAPVRKKAADVKKSVKKITLTKKKADNAKKSVTAKKSTAVGKSAPVKKKTATVKKTVKKAVAAKKSASIKKVTPVKKAVVAKKAVKKAVPAKRSASVKKSVVVKKSATVKKKSTSAGSKKSAKKTVRVKKITAKKVSVKSTKKTKK